MPPNGKLNGHDPHSRNLLAALKQAIRHGVLVCWPAGRKRPETPSAPIHMAAGRGFAAVKEPHLVPTPRDITRAEIVDSWLVA
jgi:hypothetical protein